MTDSDCPWEPPLAGTEAGHLAGALDRLRTTFRWKAGDLGAAGLQAGSGSDRGRVSDREVARRLRVSRMSVNRWRRGR
jgi:hypothetical protein